MLHLQFQALPFLCICFTNMYFCVPKTCAQPKEPAGQHQKCIGFAEAILLAGIERTELLHSGFSGEQKSAEGLRRSSLGVLLSPSWVKTDSFLCLQSTQYIRNPSAFEMQKHNLVQCTASYMADQEQVTFWEFRNNNRNHKNTKSPSNQINHK